MTQTMIPTYTLQSTKNGETLLTDILLNAGNIPVGSTRLPINKHLFEDISTYVRPDTNNHSSQTFLKALSQKSTINVFPRTLKWHEEEWDNGEWKTVGKYDEPISVLLLLKARCRANLRCPMDSDYWEEWLDAGNLRSQETYERKKEIRNKYEKNYNITNSGACIIMPSENAKNSREYIVGMANNGKFEYVLDRTDGKPNTYRIECNDGVISLIDPRLEVSLMWRS